MGDVPPGPNDVQIEKVVPASGVLTLPYALALATAHNSKYQTEKERLYKAALDLRLVEHRFETQLFGGGSLLYGYNYQHSPKRPLSKQEMMTPKPATPACRPSTPRVRLCRPRGTSVSTDCCPPGAN